MPPPEWCITVAESDACARLGRELRRRAPGLYAVLDAVARRETGRGLCSLLLESPLAAYLVLERLYGRDAAERLFRLVLEPALRAAQPPAARPPAGMLGPPGGGEAPGLGAVLACAVRAEKAAVGIYEALARSLGEPCRTPLLWVARESGLHANILEFLSRLLGAEPPEEPGCGSLVEEMERLRERLEKGRASPGEALRLLARLEESIGEEKYMSLIARGVAALLRDECERGLAKTLLEAIAAEEENHGRVALAVLRLLEAGRCPAQTTSPGTGA
jgi:rubrerythrin